MEKITLVDPDPCADSLNFLESFCIFMSGLVVIKITFAVGYMIWWRIGQPIYRMIYKTPKPSRRKSHIKRNSNKGSISSGQNGNLLRK